MQTGARPWAPVFRFSKPWIDIQIKSRARSDYHAARRIGVIALSQFNHQLSAKEARGGGAHFTTVARKRTGGDMLTSLERTSP